MCACVWCASVLRYIKAVPIALCETEEITEMYH